MSAQLQRATSPRYIGEAARRIIRLRRAAERMLAELESSQLEVVLIPSKDRDCAMRGGKIRVAHMQNAEWYQDFCAQFTAKRRARCRRCFRRCQCEKEEKRKRRWGKRPRMLHDTSIKKQDTIRGLKELTRGKCVSIYAQRLAEFISSYQQRRAA